MKFLKVTYISVLVLLINACSTDFEINAPRDETPVVYGLINAFIDPDPETNFDLPDTQFVKITHTFLGEGNILDYAQIRDSSEYNQKLKAYFIRTATLDTLLLDTITIFNKKEGQFYGGKSTVYFTKEAIEPLESYELVVEAPNKTVRAKTNTVGEILIEKPRYGGKINLVNGSLAPWTYRELEVDYTTSENVKYVEVSLILSYTEYYQDNTNELKQFEYFVGSREAETDAGRENVSFKWNTENFFRKLSEIETPENVVKRIPFVGTDIKDQAFEYKFTIAGNEINTYIDLQNPSTGIVQEKPIYSNVANGLGI
ncbi:MAG: hypothetical protein ACI9RL_001711, partial [Candidatus Paceibacteria bacterium]